MNQFQLEKNLHQVKEFIASFLYGKEIALDTPNTVRNLSELAATKTIV